MARLVTVVLILAVIASAITAPATGRKKRERNSVTASDGSIAVGYLYGETFGDGAFSIGHGGMSTGKGHGGHGGNQGTNSYGGPGGDSGHTNYS